MAAKAGAPFWLKALARWYLGRLSSRKETRGGHHSWEQLKVHFHAKCEAKPFSRLWLRRTGKSVQYFWHRHDPIEWYHRQVKETWIRGRKGWAPSDVWSVDWYLSRVIPEMLEALRDNSCSMPFKPEPVNIEDFFSEDNVHSMQEWQDLLTEAAAGFRAWHAYHDLTLEDTKRGDYDEAKQKLKRSFEVLNLYWGALWD
jgi:hypothetical protein